MKSEPIAPMTTAALFDHYRTKLISLAEHSRDKLKELAKVGSLNAHGMRQLAVMEYALSILRQNVLPASLMAAFQIGKSTTTTAMADGREIIPCGRGGGGLRTSALPVTVYSDPHTTNVTLSLYTKDELMQQLISLLAAHLENKEAVYDLDSAADRAELMKALGAELAVYAAASDYENDRLSLLRNAVLILSFYGSDAHRRLLDGEFKTVTDIQPFIAFPSDLESRWESLRSRGLELMNDKGEDGEPLFDALHCLYVFIQSVTIPVHSEFMESTGTAVIDAPGTMASIEDTRRALKAASEAAVVLFLLDGEQQLSAADKDMLRTLKNAGIADKVVFAINFRKNPAIIAQKGGVGEAILSGLRAAGYDAPHQQKLHYYNAFLAVRAAQGRLMLNGQLDELTKQAIMTDAEKRMITFSTVEEAWKKSTIGVLNAIGAEDEAFDLRLKGLCAETVESICRVSQWREMIDALRSHVISNRITGILLDLGSRPIYNALTEIEGELAERERNATLSEETARAQYKEAEKLFDRYCDAVNDILDENFDTSIDDQLAEDYFNQVLLPAAEQAGEQAAPITLKLSGVKGTLKDIGNKIHYAANKVGNFIFKEILLADSKVFADVEINGIKENCARTVHSCYERAMTEYATRWSNRLEYSDVYRSRIQKNVRKTQRRLISLWKELGLNENPLLQSINPAPVTLSGLMSEDAMSAQVRNAISAINVEGTISARLNKAFLSGLGIFLGSNFIYWFILPIDFIIPGFAELALLLSAVVSAIVFVLSNGLRDKKTHQIAAEITASLNKSLLQHKNDILKNIKNGSNDNLNACSGVSMLREFYVTTFAAILQQQRDDLKARYEQQLEDLRRCEDERAAVAQTAQQWRTEVIEPLRKELGDTMAEINEAFK